MSYLILFDEEKNVVEIQYEGVNAALLAEITIRLTNLENEFETSQGGNNQAQEDLEDDIDSLTTLVAALSSALTTEIDRREQGDITVAEDAANALFQVNEDLSRDISQEAEIRAQAILDESTARGAAIAESEATIMTDVAILATSVEGMATRLGAAESSIIEVSDALVTETAARVAQYSALQADYGDTNAAILEETVARADADTALAYQISILEVSVGDSSAAITAETSARIAADSSIEAKYSIKVDINGYVAGFGLIATENDGVPTSSFIVLAEEFAVVMPGATPTVPFRVDAGITYIQNVVIDWALIANAVISEANIADASITTAKIADLAVTAAKIQNATITSAKIGDAQITTAKIQDAAIVAAKIKTLEVGTIAIAGAAVTVPISVQTTWELGGQGMLNYYVVGVASITNTATFPMQVTGLVTAHQGFSSGNKTWAHRIHMTGSAGEDTYVFSIGGGAVLDCVSFQFSDVVQPGATHNYYHEWAGDSLVHLYERTTTLLGTKR